MQNNLRVQLAAALAATLGFAISGTANADNFEHSQLSVTDRQSSVLAQNGQLSVAKNTDSTKYTGKGDEADEPYKSKTPTTGSRYLEPIHFFETHFSVSYNPTIEWDVQGGSNGAGLMHRTIRNGRALSLYEIGPLTKHVSTFVHYFPLDLNNGFFPKVGDGDVRVNFGNAERFVQLTGGVEHILNIHNSGFGFADRPITQTMPFIYAPFNGFNPYMPNRGLNLDYTLPGWTTAKTFMFFQQPLGPNANPKFERPRGFGLVLEKVMSKKTLSGVQLQSVFGWTPTAVNRPFQFALPNNSAEQAFANTFAEFNGQPLPAVPVLNINQINTSVNKFQRFWALANKAFNDRSGFERANAEFGFLLAHDSRNFMLADRNTGILGQRSVSYGYSIELITIPIPRHLSLITRYDQLRPNNHMPNNTMYAFSVGMALDIAGPNRPAELDRVMQHWGRAHGKLTFDYQIIGLHAAKPSHRFIIGWWPII